MSLCIPICIHILLLFTYNLLNFALLMLNFYQFIYMMSTQKLGVATKKSYEYGVVYLE